MAVRAGHAVDAECTNLVSKLRQDTRWQPAQIGWKPDGLKDGLHDVCSNAKRRPEPVRVPVQLNPFINQNGGRLRIFCLLRFLCRNLEKSNLISYNQFSCD